jgi:PAS domain S-box-containing protein
VVDKGAYDELPDGVVVADADGRVVLVNPAAERLLGRTVDESLGHDLTEVLPLVDGQGRDWWGCTRPYDGLATRVRQPEHVLTLSPGPDGDDRDLLVTASYVRDEQRRLDRLVVCLRDTTARARIERSGSELVSTVAHELRSPLTSVKGFTATLLAKWDRFNDDQKRLMLETVNADADRVTRLITELLDIARIDSGRLTVSRQLVDLDRVVRRHVDGLVASGHQRDGFDVQVETDLPEIWADADKLDQVIANLLENAVRHGAGRVTIVIAPVDDGAAVTVMDEGEGIPVELHDRVFTRFWRSGRRGGTGLGLYIVRGLVEAHGGHIEVGRAPGGGARFRFVLPAATPDFAD